MVRRVLYRLGLASALLCVGGSPALAGTSTYSLEARNIDLLAAKLVGGKWLGPKDRVYVTSSVPGSGLDDQFFEDMLVSGLLHRGIAVVADPAGATKILSYMWLRSHKRPIEDMPRFNGDRPAQEAELDNRILVQITDRRTHAIVASELLDAATPMRAIPPATAPGGGPAPSNVGSPAILPAPLAEVVSHEPANALGIGVSWLSGSGLTYRHWFPDGLGFQVAAVPFLSVSPDASGSDQLTGLGNIGVQGMGKVLRWQNFRLYWLLGFGYAYNTWFTDGVTPRNDFGIAPGIGADWMLNSNVALNLSLGYTVSYTKIGTLPGQLGFSPGAGGGLFLDW